MSGESSAPRRTRPRAPVRPSLTALTARDCARCSVRREAAAEILRAVEAVRIRATPCDCGALQVIHAQ